MSKGNGQADVRMIDEEQKQKETLENEIPAAELPAADTGDGFEEKSADQDRPAVAVAENAQDSDVKKLQAERDNLFDRLARLQAEFDNYRKRSAKENAEFREFAVADAARALLPVIDSFELAMKNASSSPQDLRKGMELIHKQLQDVLRRLSIQRIPAAGSQFDPHVHEAIEMVERDDVPDHQVVDELQAGYRIKERLLRPAMVRVAKKAD